MENEENAQGNTKLVFKAVGLAMAVAVIVLNVLGAAPVQTLTMLLGIGLFGLALSALHDASPRA